METNEFKDSYWDSIRVFINSKNIGDKIYRKDLIEASDALEHYIDYVRWLLEKLCYFSKTNKPGAFYLNRYIPDTSINKLRKQYNENRR